MNLTSCKKYTPSFGVDSDLSKLKCLFSLISDKTNIVMHPCIFNMIIDFDYAHYVSHPFANHIMQRVSYGKI